MTTLHKHFQRIKEIVDWAWTLALLCLIGYITLGQLVQLYWAMLFFGGLAGSFGLFYQFSCEKLKELDFFNDDQLLNAEALIYKCELLLDSFTDRNPRLINQYLNLLQSQKKVNLSRDKVKTILTKHGYECVKGHWRSNGKWVKPYYRRKRK